LRCGSWFYVGDLDTADSRHVVASGSGTTGDQNLGTITSNPSGKEANKVYRRNLDIRIWKWDQDIESLVPLKGQTDEECQEALRFKANLGTLWQIGGLFPYQGRADTGGKRQGDTSNSLQFGEGDVEENPGLAQRREWSSLTSHLSSQVLSRIVGDTDLDLDYRPRWTVTSASTAARDADQIPGLSNKEAMEGGLAGDQEKELCFLPIDLKRTWREGAIGRERTEAAQDRSWALQDLIDRYTSSSSNESHGESQVLGELQFCFLMILTLMNYSCLEQWKRLLSLIFTCRTAIATKEAFFTNVLHLLLLQLKHCDDVEGGLFEIDGDYGGAFLRKLLTTFRKAMEEVLDSTKSPVKSAMYELERWVQTTYGWELRREAIVRRGMVELEDGERVEMEMSGADEEDETGEYAPVIVDLGDETLCVSPDM
jgi:A1 cistron-splicing factor AAR2